MAKRDVTIFDCDANDCPNKATVSTSNYRNPDGWLLVDTYNENGPSLKPLSFCPEHSETFVSVVTKELLSGE